MWASTRPIDPARLVREPLPAGADPALAARWLRGEPRPVALSGAWAGGGVLLSSHPAAVAADPFAVLDAQPDVESAVDGAVGGGWIGWLGFGLARELEPVPPPPPRPEPVTPFDLAFHDHVVRCDADGRWWFEALWTEARADVLDERLRTWRARLAGPPPEAHAVAAGPLRIAAPGGGGHASAVAEAIERIAAGEVFQANICLRLDGPIDGDALDLWVRGVGVTKPAYAAFVGGRDHVVASLSPELFLRRDGRTVTSSPIKGTAPITSDPALLAASVKDRAENVMIVDLMRNDLGRVCEYGSVTVPELFAVRPAAGVWHLVSTVQGTLRDGVGDRDLLRATFPPGSVIGAPKVRALRVISELEATAREAYCGAIGLCSPLSGLELNVAIRTFEARGGRLWLGAGGGIVSDSVPAAEVEEALVKARGAAAAAGIEVDASAAGPAPPPAEIVRHARPDPARGVLETLLVRDGEAADAARHLERLRASCAALRLFVPPDLAERANGAAAALGAGRLRIVIDAAGAHLSTGALPAPGPSELRPVVLPGGLGAHKWADRTLIDRLSARASTPLFCDLDGHVLEAGYAAVLIVERDVVVAPPLDGRILPSVSRRRALDDAVAAGLRVRVEPFTLARAAAADAIVLTSALRGPHPGVLAGGPPAAATDAVLARWRRADLPIV
jgi:anthranilate/para-aminobenzoate synthase component I/branched-subunit amino acid aminotransferase/4-amino-4-deoxychorismate lyase